MDATPFDREAEYWMSKRGIPTALEPAIRPWLDRGLSALDLGCGGGRLAVAIAPQMGRVVGVDAAAELLQQAATAHPSIHFVRGDCLLDATWNALGGPFDLIASNCSIRRDYTPDLHRLAQLCHAHLAPGGGIALRIQGDQDLASLLPQSVRSALLYSKDEVARAFAGFADLAIATDEYRQRFSGEAYLRTFLARIGLPSERITVKSRGVVVGVRSAWIVTGRRDGNR
jgi:trans-aconitate methyltransferase